MFQGSSQKRKLFFEHFLGKSMDWIVQSARLSLSEFSTQDVAGLYALNADPIVLRHTGDDPFADEAAAATFVRQYQAVYQQHGMGRWTIRLRSDGTYLGWCGLKRHEDQSVDLGFRLLQAHWNQGYATEAAAACLRYGFAELGLVEIIGRAALDNLASIRVLEKIGMEFWKEEVIEGIGRGVLYRTSR